MIVVAVLLACIAATNILVEGATITVPIPEAPTEDEVPECIEDEVSQIYQ